MAKIIFIFLCQWMPSHHAEIATKQAVLETGWFESEAFTESNNPFGLMWKGKLQKFSSVEEACEEYFKQIYSQYEGGDYYQFLKDLPYAEDPKYIWKIKHIDLRL